MGEQVRVERVLRAMPPRILQYYLQDLGGILVSEEEVEGPGWKAHMQRLEDFQLGSLRVGQLNFVLEGDAAVIEALLPRLDLKLLRAGA
jgi:hypothetical protein